MLGEGADVGRLADLASEGESILKVAESDAIANCRLAPGEKLGLAPPTELALPPTPTPAPIPLKEFSATLIPVFLIIGVGLGFTQTIGTGEGDGIELGSTGSAFGSFHHV